MYSIFVVQPLSCLWHLWPHGCSTPGFSVRHQHLELALTHAHWVADAIQPSHLLLPLSPPAFSLSQHQGLFQWVSSSHQSIGVLASASVLPKNIQDWFPLGFTGLISLQSKGLSRLFSNSSKAPVLWRSVFFTVQLSHQYIATGKTVALTIWTFVGKCLLFNTLSRFVIAFLPRSKQLLVPWLQSPSGVILEPKKVKSVTISIVSPSICHEVMGLDAVILVILFNFFWS